jgi:hypothetical protein
MTTVEDADEYACQLYVCKLLEIIETAPRHLRLMIQSEPRTAGVLSFAN